MPEQPTLRERIEHIVKVAIEGIRENTLRDPSDDAMHWLEDTVFDIMNALEPARQASTDVGLRKALEKITAIEHEQDPVHDEYGFDTCHVEGYNNGLSECQDIARQALAGGTDGWRPTHKHLKSGGLYKLIHNVQLEATNTSAVLYQGEDGAYWVRDYAEFFDGRFEPLPSPPQRGRE